MLLISTETPNLMNILGPFALGILYREVFFQFPGREPRRFLLAGTHPVYSWELMTAAMEIIAMDSQRPTTLDQVTGTSSPHMRLVSWNEDTCTATFE